MPTATQQASLADGFRSGLFKHSNPRHSCCTVNNSSICLCTGRCVDVCLVKRMCFVLAMESCCGPFWRVKSHTPVSSIFLTFHCHRDMEVCKITQRFSSPLGESWSCPTDAISSLVRLRIPEGDRPPLEDIDPGQAEGLGPLVDMIPRCWDSVPKQRPSFLGRTSSAVEYWTNLLYIK